MKYLIKKHGFSYKGVIHLADGSPRLAYQLLKTGVLCEPLKNEIEISILPRYESFDDAHKRDHAESVIRNSIKLAQHYDVDINMVYTIAAYHDLGLCEGRERHHIVSGEIMMNDSRLWQWFSEDDLKLMAEAIEDHRASSGNAPRSIYGKIVAEADRDIEPIKILRRTVQYGLSNYPELDKEQQWHRFLEHLNEKYADGGYLKLWLPESDNAAKLAELRRIIKDKKPLREYFEEFFNQSAS
ncbi:MAG: HD domain-containing protein [Bacteroidales bacterium]|nr:HD domain-containing protein [Bacteroidales bacterium]